MTCHHQRKGLHARASAKFVETVERFNARATVEKDGMSVSGDSIMGLLMLTSAARQHDPRHHLGRAGRRTGEALSAFVGDYFGEGMAGRVARSSYHHGNLRQAWSRQPSA